MKKSYQTPEINLVTLTDVMTTSVCVDGYAGCEGGYDR